MTLLTHHRVNDVSSSKWYDVDQKHASISDSKKMGKTTIQTFSSPYDVPEKVRVRYDKAAEMLLIELLYIGGEEPLEEQTDGPVTLKIGRHSGRIHNVEVLPMSIDALSIDAKINFEKDVKEVEKAISSLEEPRKSWPFRCAKPIALENYKIARQIVDESIDFLFDLILKSQK